VGGIFINYRRGDHEDLVQELYDWLERHFGEDQVFRDVASLVPGQRYPDALRERVADCEVLLVVVHDGWTQARDESGVRRLEREDDWVRREIEQALGDGTTVIPLLLDAVEPPRPTELPGAIRDLAHRQAHRLRTGRSHGDLTDLLAVLESHVAPTWQPVPAPRPPRGIRPGRWLGVLTALAACAVLVTLPALPQDDGWADRNGVPFTLYGLLGSCLAMAVPLVAVGVVRGPLRRSVNSWERELHSVRHRTYVRQTWPAAAALLLATVIGAFALNGDLSMALGVVLVVALAVGRTAALSIRLERRDKELWATWPHALPGRVSRPELRRAIARLELRTAEWLRPLSREQREKAQWELAEIGRALTRLERQGDRSRGEWLSADHPWLLSGYVLWLALTAALAVATGIAFGSAGMGRPLGYAVLAGVALIGTALCLCTMEVAYRHQRWQLAELLTEATGRTAELARRVTSLSAPARTRPSALAPRPEQFAEPD
jgi:hypothetical protein